MVMFWCRTKQSQLRSPKTNTKLPNNTFVFLDSHSEVALASSHRMMRLPCHLRDSLLHEIELGILKVLENKEIEKMILSDIFCRCAFLSNFLYGSYVTRLKEENFLSSPKLVMNVLELELASIFGGLLVISHNVTLGPEKRRQMIFFFRRGSIPTTFGAKRGFPASHVGFSVIVPGVWVPSTGCIWVFIPFVFAVQVLVILTNVSGICQTLMVDSFAYLPPNSKHHFESYESSTLVVFEKRYAYLEDHIPEPIVGSTN
ncbi:unnamed protein product [Lactuca saligna]|uniref:Uncharacterized protein n=1 Tax=Lactuca saligna TaxID=75948 RepID=A0AA36EGC6_LACSI|nr:unnamed protein product [Lactuca saligna]